MLKILAALSLNAAIIATAIAQNAPATTSNTTSNNAAAPRAGEWRYQVKMSGGPMGGHEHTGDACIAQSQLDSGFERALLSATPEPPAKGRGRMGAGPKCDYTDIQRTSSGRSGAVAVCDGPMGRIEGPVAIQYGPETFDAQQTMDMNGPFGAMRMERKVSARRLGPCKK